MTDTILSPNGVEAYSQKVIIVPSLGAVAPVGSLTPAQVQDLRDDVQAVLNQELGDLSNVSEVGKATGLVLVVQPDGTWAPDEVTGVIERVSTNWNANQALDVELITVGAGIDVNSTLGANRAHLQLVWGASGSAPVVSRADHTHPPTLKGRYQFNKSAAVLGGGTNVLIDETVTGLVPGVVYDVSLIGTLEAVNTNSSGRLIIYTQIGSATPQSKGRGFSGGVWTEVTAVGTRMSVTGVSSLQLRFWAEYSTGDPTALYTGDLTYDIAPRGGMM